jgi:hypothetical protein
MSNKREKIVTVTLEDGKKINIKVIKPTNRLNSAAQRIGATVWTQCIQDGVMTKQELKTLMEKKKIWGKEDDQKQKDLQQGIADLEKELYINKRKKIKLSEAKAIAFKMQKKRIALRDHIARRIELEGNTAESLSDNAKFDFLVANCTLWENGNKVYNSMDAYQDSSDDTIAFTAASTLAEMLYAIDPEFEKALPENRFLIAAGVVNEELEYVDKDGERPDRDGKTINDLGWFQDDKGNRVDAHGNPLSDNGTYIPQVTYIDDETGKEVVINVGDESDESDEPEEAKKPEKPEEPAAETEDAEETNDTES